MPVTLIPSHIPNQDNATHWSGDRRGEMPISTSLSSLVGSFTYSIMMSPEQFELGIMSRGDTGNPDWGLYCKLVNNGIVEIGIQDNTNQKLIYRTSTQDAALDIPFELTIRLDYTLRTFTFFINAIPKITTLVAGTTTTLAALAPLMVPSSDTNWYFGWVNGSTNFIGKYYGDFIIDSALTDAQIYQYYSNRAYTGASPTTGKIYFGSNRGDVGNSHFTLYKAAPSGANALSISAGATDQRGYSGCTVSPDGTKIVYWANGNLNGNIIVANADGSSSKVISDGTTNPITSNRGVDPVWVDNTNLLVTYYNDFSPYNQRDYAYGLASVPTGNTLINVTTPELTDKLGIGSGTFSYQPLTGAVDITNPNAIKFFGVYRDTNANFVLTSWIHQRGTLSNLYANPPGVVAPSIIDAASQLTGLKINKAKTQIGYSKLISGYWHIFTANAGGGNIQQLTTGNNNNFVGAFSPDDTKMVIASDQGRAAASWNMFTMNISGANKQNISGNSSFLDFPYDWV